MSKTRVLIVDDSAYSRQTIKKMLEKDSHIEIVGVSADGLDAMSKAISLKPDLITLDLEMPEMDGFTFLRWLMKTRPTPVIIVSSFSDSKTVFKALELGAADFITKPPKISSPEYQNMVRDLLNKVRGMKSLRLDRLSRNLSLSGYGDEKQIPADITDSSVEAVAIGASTGGPSALNIVLTQIPADFPAGIAISQHMPKGFTASFAERLNSICKIRIKEAREGDELQIGTALICPGGYHLVFKKRGRRAVATLREPKSSDKYVPSVDLMMSSVADIFEKKSVGIVLTGMGNDGTAGMLDIQKVGGYTIVESEETAVVFGMPSEVIKAGAAKKILPISEIPNEVVRFVKRMEERKIDR